MNTVHQLAVGNANSHMQSILASINWELAQQIVFELEVRLADALARNQENRAKLHRHMLRVSFSARALANRQPSPTPAKAKWMVPVSSLLAQVVPLATLSISHLSKATRRKLASDSLSVPSYPNQYGGFVYVGDDATDMPEEADLFAIAEVAHLANLTWLKFDRDAIVIDGLPVFED